MKFILKLITFLIFCSFVNASDLEVIDLHTTKTLDQMILDGVEIKDELLTQDSDNEQNESEITTSIDDAEILEDTISNDVEENEIENSSYWKTVNVDQLNNYISNSKNLRSKVIYNEYSDFLLQSQLDLDDQKDEEIFLQIVNYFYDIGDISKSYQLLQTTNIENKKYSNTYKTIEINYLLSTYQLKKVCNKKNDVDSDFKTATFLFQKIDIFCLILENKVDEANLQNSILIESENKVDNYFQNIFNYIINDDFAFDQDNKKLNLEINKELIFLYSAMMRIAELPLDESFLELDINNLAIPIILNTTTSIETRIRAANIAFLNEQISIESLAALYQSVDFDTKQFNEIDETILQLKESNEKLLSFYYQFTNIQIFPAQRLDALIRFWSFAKKNNLEDIVYPLTLNIANTIEVSVDNANFGTEIAKAYIHNKKYEEAKNWITYYENINGKDNKSTYSNILLELYSTQEVYKILEIIETNVSVFQNTQSKTNNELLINLINVFKSDKNLLLNLDFDNIYDDRKMPSQALNQIINNSIETNNDEALLIFIAISMNNKNWNDIHPQHLIKILEGFKNYKNEKLIKSLIIEILKSFDIL